MAQGCLSKLETQDTHPVSYGLRLGPKTILLNELIGTEIHICHTGRIECVSCRKVIPKAFGQGFCYNCFMTAAENSPCIIRPELCEGHLGKGRDPQWEQDNHVQPHAVYLAISSGLKVGITRMTQIPTRWLDQGAQRAIVVAETPNRYLCGKIEVALKAHYADKSAWQALLKGDPDLSTDLVAEKQQALRYLDFELRAFASLNDFVYQFTYPIRQRPIKVKSINLTKSPLVSGRLLGILGQYLMLDGDRVLNVRNHSGYEVKFN